jgi:hypothetical protein
MDNLKEKLKETITPLYTEMWNNCISVSNEIGGYVPQWGKNYPEGKHEGLLFIGKAPNLRLSNNPWKEKGLDVLNSIGKEDLSWLENNKCSKSAYMRVFSEICKELHKGKDDKWYSYVAISNLYKIANLNANFPTAKLLDAQKNFARKIFVKELEVLSPKFVVMFSSKMEKDGFLYDFQNDGNHTNSVCSENWGKNYETKVYDIRDTIIITSPHPERKNEEEHVKVIVKLLKDYGYGK